MRCPTLLLYLASVGITWGYNLITSLSGLQDFEYDFVVVGGGTAGSVIAARLTENPDISVLLVEDGPSNQGQFNTMVPFLAFSLQKSPVDWNFTTTAQTGLLNRTLAFPRGHVLGGSSSINVMAYNRGSNDVYERWAALTEDPGWSWPSVQKYYLKSSRLVQPADGHNTSGQVDPAVHGNGPVEVSVYGFHQDLDDMVIDTSKELGGRFKFTTDLNAGDFVGIAYFQATIGNSKRSSSAVAYLDPLLESRSNLFVLVNTRATKLISSPSSKSYGIFRTVELGQQTTDQRVRVQARKEVILSAGVIGTPQILLLSGIGPKKTLQRLGIQTAVDLPDVGQNLIDQPQVPSYFFVNSTSTFDDIVRNATLTGQALQLWNSTGQGLLVDPPSGTQGFMRLPPDSPIFKKFKDPSAGKLSGNTELLFVNGFAPFGSFVRPATGNYISILSVVVSPLSRHILLLLAYSINTSAGGSVTLSSSDPFAQPIIDPGFLTNDFDIFAMVQSMKDAQYLIKNGPMSTIVTAPFAELANATTDETMAIYARNFSLSINHGVGTARMSPATANWGVVDSHLLVKGVEGLRVVDASVFPAIPECHTQAPTYIVAERGAELIKAMYGI